MHLLTEMHARSERVAFEAELSRSLTLARLASTVQPATRSRSARVIRSARWTTMLLALSTIAACSHDGVDDAAARQVVTGPATVDAVPAETATPTTDSDGGSPDSTARSAPSTSPLVHGPATATASAWRGEVTAMCDRMVAEATSIPAHDGTAEGLTAFIEAHRAARARIGSLDVVPLPAEVRGGPHAITREQSLAEVALTSAAQAATGGDVTAAQAAFDRYLFHMLKIANVFAVAGARCGTADPARAATADLNVPLDLRPLIVTSGFGSLWVTEEFGSRVARVDPASGEVLATIDAGEQPVKLQPADGRMWGRNSDAFFAIDPATNTITAALAKADVGPNAERAWAVDGGLWICDGQRLHRYDPTSLQPITAIQLGIRCDLPGGTSDLIVASTYNSDAGQSGTAAAAFIDPANNQLLATVNLPVDVTIGIVLDDSVFFAGEHGSQAVVVDRGTWTVRATPDLGRQTGDLGTVEADGTSIYVPTLDARDVLVVDASTFAATDTIETLGVHSVTLDGNSLWTAYSDGFLQRFVLAQ